jgi:hypothetical protein
MLLSTCSWLRFDHFLFYVCRYHYDKATGSWVMGLEQEPADIQSSSTNSATAGDTGSSSNASKKMTREQLEEHGLVLAIQAAHVAAMEKKDGHSRGLGSVSSCVQNI